MKVYGRRSVIVKRPADTVAFSDEESESMSSDFIHENKESSQSSDLFEDAAINKSAATNNIVTKEILPNSDGFDDLFGDNIDDAPRKSKRRKTYSKDISITTRESLTIDSDDDDRSFEDDTSIRDISNYLDQIKTNDEKLKSDILNKAADYNSPNNGGTCILNPKHKKGYGLNRTYLIDNGNKIKDDDSNEPAQPMIDNSTATIQHFRALKTMGSKLQYDDDIGEIFNEFRKLKSDNELIDALLRFIINAINDTEYFEYIMYSHLNDLLNLMIKTVSPDCISPTICSIFSEILLMIPNKEILNEAFNIDIANIYTILLKSNQENHSNNKLHYSYLNHNKNYQEYMKLSKMSSKTNYYKGLQLIIQFLKSIEILQQEATLMLIKTLIRNEENHSVNINHSITEEDLINSLKGLILLTNNLPKIFDHSAEVDGYFLQTLDDTLKMISKTGEEDERNILSSALCVNIVLCFPITCSREIIQETEELLQKQLSIHSNLDVEKYPLSLKFLLLCYLNLCDSPSILNSSENQNKSRGMKNRVRSILISIKNVNETIEKNVKERISQLDD